MRIPRRNREQRVETIKYGMGGGWKWKVRLRKPKLNSRTEFWGHKERRAKIIRLSKTSF